MAKAAETITLSASRDIPFNKLKLSQANVRRFKAGVSIEDLAEDIARRSLLQSINVRPIRDAEGGETGMYEIPAGGRRYRALALLVKQKRLAKTALVPCVVREASDDVTAEEDSLAENMHRSALHPLDQFDAFQTLRNQGAGEEEIAARFFVTPAVVKQRLKLAGVSPKLRKIYGDDGMSLEQLMAFTVCDDHARQERVWASVAQSWNNEPQHIRRLLTEGAVPAGDKRAQFIGLETYEAAGGVIVRDLFEADQGGWLQDSALLDRLVNEKLKTDADAIATEGWKWIEAAISFPYGHDAALRKLDGLAHDLTPDEQAQRDAHQTEYDKLEAEYADVEELPDEIDRRLGELEEALASFDERSLVYEPTDIARAGVFLRIDADGALCIDRGYVRPEDDIPGEHDEESERNGACAAAGPTVISIGGETNAGEEEEAMRPLPDRLVGELTAHRTLALREALASKPQIAVIALLHQFCLDAFHGSGQNGCVEIAVRSSAFPAQVDDLKTCDAAKAIAARHNAWKAQAPKGEQALWDWIASLGDAKRALLLSHCVSLSVNALYERANPYGGTISTSGVKRRVAQADRLARAVELDMTAAGWRPTVDSYLGRVTKHRILDAVREAKGEAAAQLIDHLKKGDMAKEAERLLDGTGWLPEPLRIREEIDDAGALPDFLAEDEVIDADADEEPSPTRSAR